MRQVSIESLLHIQISKVSTFKPTRQFWDSGGVKLESLCNLQGDRMATRLRFQYMQKKAQIGGPDPPKMAQIHAGTHKIGPK